MAKATKSSIKEAICLEDKNNRWIVVPDFRENAAQCHIAAGYRNSKR
jgi:hypothetical protein